MILKKNFDLRKVFFYVRIEVTITLIIATMIFLLYRYKIIALFLPFSIAAILGSAIAIFIAFRNQSAYGRWWEARTIWGGIINNSRIFARQVIANTDSAVTAGKTTAAEAETYKREMIFRQIAFAHALRIQLRKENSWEKLSYRVSSEEYKELLSTKNKANMLLMKQGIRIKQAILEEKLGAFDNISMEPNLAALNNWQGACERIKNTPLPRNYHYFTRLFLYVFILILPFSLIGDFTKMNIDFMLIPVSFLICFVFAVMNKVGELNEDPFENRITDVPITTLCGTIEADLEEMLGIQSSLPENTEHAYHF